MDSKASGHKRKAAGSGISSETSGSKPSLPAEIRALGAILIFDFLLGVWLAVHTRGAITAYLAPQLPAVGLGALCWGFLPDEPKKGFGRWLARWLAAPAVYSSIILAGAVGLGASLLVTTVIVESVDPFVSTTLYLVRGSGDEVNEKARREAETLRLNRLTTPQRSHLLIVPLGQKVWVYSSTHVSVATPRIIPWIPTVLQYPDDFEPLVAIDLLPGPELIPKLYRGDIEFKMWTQEEERRIVAQGMLHEGSTRVAFTRPAAIASETISRWQSRLEEILSDPAFVKPMLAAWQNTDWFEARYPLRVNDELYYEIRTESNELILKGKVTLTDVVTLLDLSG